MSTRCVQHLDYCMDRLHKRCPEGWDTYTTSWHWGNPNGPDYSQMPDGTIVPGSVSMYGTTRPWYALERERADWIYYSATVECKTRRTAEIDPAASPPRSDRETGN
jgi:hypothetical protein